MAKEKETTADGRPPRKDVFFLTLDQIKIEEGFNVRQDYGDINELAESIKENGVRVPIRGYKKNGVYWITDGHRRYKAVQLLDKKGLEVRIPFLADGRESSQEQRVIDMIICNEGKKLNPVEVADAVNRLLNFGYTEGEIHVKTGYSKVYISNLKLLNSAPKKIKNLITDNVIKSTLAMKILREEKDFDKAMEVIENAIASAGAEGGGSSKITQKNVSKSKGKINSYAELKKIFKKAEKKGLVPRQDKIDVFMFVKSVNDGELSYNALLSELYEPEIEKEKAPKKTKKKKNTQTTIPMED
jgi:ParB/RepB/Spo0J family partition protein